jgi:spoIIIJ-associated protein
MESIEISAKSEEEAVAIALAELGMGRSEVEVVVIKRGRSGIFGLGSEEVRVRVTPLERLPEGKIEIVDMAKEVLETLLSLMNVPASVNVGKRGVGEQETILFDIRGEDLGILIGRRGETLSALQYLVNLTVSRQVKARVGVVVDVEGYRQRRQESLQLLARRLADRVKSNGKTVTLEPMPPGERRIIHLELRDDPEVTTHSVGYGEDRKVAITLKSNNRNSRTTRIEAT